MNTAEITIPKKKQRTFLPENLNIDSWKVLEPYFQDLKDRKINSKSDLEKWMKDLSEFESVLSEDAGWRYIKMTCDTTNEANKKAYQFFVTEIEPKAAPYFNDFNKKLIESPFVNELDQDKYHIYLRKVKKAIEIFREENIPLFTEIQTERQKYAEIAGAMTVKINGEEVTLQRAASYLKDTDRKVREEVFNKIQERKAVDEEKLNDLFTHLVKLNDKVAINAGYQNYRNYKFDELGRFDYTVRDCQDFHYSISKEIVPIVEEFDRQRKESLNLDKLKPYDLEVDAEGKSPLKPFATGAELIDKTVECFTKTHTYFAECLAVMKQMGHLDLESKKGKAPGGYNYPLYEIGVPFIFMNSVGTLRDLVTMVHEGGHAVHSFLSKDLELTEFKNLPSEVAELASMSMELISMEHWDVFFNNKEELKRAKREQLEKVLRGLPWIARIDKFQHWIYENPFHSVDERYDYWKKLGKEFGSDVIDWSGYENAAARSWQSQLHLYEVPFYYIEYGMAQLGAIAMWRNYKENPQQALEQYMEALKLGYTKSIGETYRTAGIKFDFSASYVKELANFVKDELKKIN